jgi:hypothetical protein
MISIQISKFWATLLGCEVFLSAPTSVAILALLVWLAYRDNGLRWELSA